MKINERFTTIYNNASVDLNNAYLSLRDKQWVSKRHHVQCMICGSELYSQYLYGKNVSEYSPEQCGWLHVKITDGLYKGTGWICHSCNGHFHDHYVDKYKIMDCLDYKQDGETQFILDRYNVECLNKKKSQNRVLMIDSKKLMDTLDIGLDNGYEIKLKENADV